MPGEDNPLKIGGNILSDAYGSAQRLKFQTKLAGLSRPDNSFTINELSNSPAALKADAKSAKAATDFEALLLHEMLKEMWNTVPDNGLLSGSREEKIYRDMLTEELAGNIAENQSIGIKEVVLKELQKPDRK